MQALQLRDDSTDVHAEGFVGLAASPCVAPRPAMGGIAHLAGDRWVLCGSARIHPRVANQPTWAQRTALLQGATRSPRARGKKGTCPALTMPCEKHGGLEHGCRSGASWDGIPCRECWPSRETGQVFQTRCERSGLQIRKQVALRVCRQVCTRTTHSGRQIQSSRAARCRMFPALNAVQSGCSRPQCMAEQRVQAAPRTRVRGRIDGAGVHKGRARRTTLRAATRDSAD